MKILSWNVNGLAACIEKGFFRNVNHTNADIICVQETKGRCPFETPGYDQYWNPAERKGYSGTLVLCRLSASPLSVKMGFDVPKFDREGRCITLEYDEFYVINVYVPNSQRSADRLTYRCECDIAFQNYLRTLSKPVIICGDFNVARDYIDIYEENLRNEEHPPGFLSDEKDGMNVLLSMGLSDVFREFYPKKRSYTWWSSRLNKRSQDRGWRLDYFLISESLMGGVLSVKHLHYIFGSDHCPITLAFRVPHSTVNISYTRLAEQWENIDWTAAETYLAQMQESIAIAAYTHSREKLEFFQKELVRSIQAKVLAVREVAKTNSMAGIDGMKLGKDDSAEKMAIALSLTSRDYHVTPFRQIEIVTEHSKIRKIKVPILYDKAMQKLYGYSLLPVAEALGDKKSFAFRKGRSPYDAHAYLVRDLGGQDPPRWILRADKERDLG